MNVPEAEKTAAAKVFDCGCGGTHHSTCNKRDTTLEPRKTFASGYMERHRQGLELEGCIEELLRYFIRHDDEPDEVRNLFAEYKIYRQQVYGEK